MAQNISAVQGGAQTPAERRALQDLSRRIGVVTPWKALTLGSGWTSIAQAVESRIAGGYVELRGNIDWTVGPANPMATLPLGQRPSAQLLFPTVLDTGSGTNRSLNILIEANGEISLSGLDATAGLFGLNHVRFSLL